MDRISRAIALSVLFVATFAAFSLAISYQQYASVGSTLLAEARHLQKDTEDVFADLDQRTRVADALGSAGAPAQWQIDRGTLERSAIDLAPRLQGSICRLESWNNSSGWLMGRFVPPTLSVTMTECQRLNPYEPSLNNTTSDMPNANVWAENNFARATANLNLINALLPALFGLLGALLHVCVTLLRTPGGWREPTTPELAGYYLSGLIGLIAGVLIGQLIKSTEPAPSALALALVAGYSVDILLAAIDSIIATFHFALGRRPEA